MIATSVQHDDSPPCSKWQDGQPYNVILFYRYVNIVDVEALVCKLKEVCNFQGLLGRILVAPEGINGTLAGSSSGIDAFVDRMKRDERFCKVDWKFSFIESGSSCLPFLSLSIRETKEIISSGRSKAFISSNTDYCSESFGGLSGSGEHLTPADFHRVLEDIEEQSGTLLDIRNKFEHDIGHFDKSIGLGCATYAESWPILDRLLEEKEPESPVYMYCTGGIRCEKASVYLKAKGFQNVFQLQGGIHRYLEEFPEGGYFKGKNFVFDGRVSVPAVTTSAVASGMSDDVITVTADPSHMSTVRGPEHDTPEKLTEVAADSSCAASDLESDPSSSAIVPDVVGRCVDCSCPYDRFSGLVVCTVCRLPVLVCDVCAEEKCYPGEYHCFRHRHLKSMYFTVLERFSVSELLSQTAALSHLEIDLLVDKKAKSRRRTLRNQKYRIAARIKEIELGSEHVEDNGAYDCISDRTAESTQDQGCDDSVFRPELISSLEVEAQESDDDANMCTTSLSSSSVTAVAAVATSSSSPSPSPSSSSYCPLGTSETPPPSTLVPPHHPSSPSCTSSSSSTSTSTSLNKENVQSDLTCTETTTTTPVTSNDENERNQRSKIPSNLENNVPPLITIPPLNNVPSNPKIRLGWGFWQS